jgi:diaminohydroxyphosphoribosylaminopyrimidine deaminase/5-amino-6-(5-phosphoribosylamino)uracil reductase
LDGKIALANGQSEWITGQEARFEGRRLRGFHDGIAVGANTAVLDNPQLTARIPEAKDPHRIVFDSQIRLAAESNLGQTAKTTPVTVICGEGYDTSAKAAVLRGLGVKVLPVPLDDNRLDLSTALSALKNLQVQTLLLEGGGTLAASFIRQGFVDVIEWFRAPVILGAEGRPAVGNLSLEHINQIYKFERIEINEVGVDIWERYQLTSAL